MSLALLGADPTEVSETPLFALGTIAHLGGGSDAEGGLYDQEDDSPRPEGGQFIYVQANGAIPAKRLVPINAGFQGQTRTSGNVIHGTRLGLTHAALADDEYGWLQITGEGVCTFAADATAGAALQLDSTTGGLVTPATAATPQCLGVHAVAAVDQSTQPDARVFLMWPVNRA